MTTLQSHRSPYEEANRTKADFLSIYDDEDPYRYYSTMKDIACTIPYSALKSFEGLVGHIDLIRGDAVRRDVLDIGCSYGVSAALIKYRITLDAIYEHYTDPERQLMGLSEALDVDRAFFHRQPPRLAVRMTGLDRAANAVDYATRVGLLDHGIDRDLEAEGGSPFPDAVPPPDLIVSTGCVGYVGQRTFSRILSSLPEPRPWIACFVLRMFDYAPISEALARFGFRTERVDGVSLPQRRFNSDEEQTHTVSRLHRLGLATAGKEDTGFLFADLFISVPARDQDKAGLPSWTGRPPSHLDRLGGRDHARQL